MDENCPHRFWVSSESDGDREYCVELGAHPLGPNEQGVMIYNGACVATMDPNATTDDGHTTHGCKDFVYNKQPKLRKFPGSAFRCKHIRAAREFALDFLIPHLLKADPNIPDDQLP